MGWMECAMRMSVKRPVETGNLHCHSTLAICEQSSMRCWLFQFLYMHRRRCRFQIKTFLTVCVLSQCAGECKDIAMWDVSFSSSRFFAVNLMNEFKSQLKRILTCIRNESVSSFQHIFRSLRIVILEIGKKKRNERKSDSFSDVNFLCS